MTEIDFEIYNTEVNYLKSEKNMNNLKYLIVMVGILSSFSPAINSMETRFNGSWSKFYPLQGVKCNIKNPILLSGGTDYIFDGGTAIRYPTKQLPSSWFKEYLISLWLYIEEHRERQYIFTWSDGDSINPGYTGFYVSR